MGAQEGEAGVPLFYSMSCVLRPQKRAKWCPENWVFYAVINLSFIGFAEGVWLFLSRMESCSGETLVAGAWSCLPWSLVRGDPRSRGCRRPPGPRGGRGAMSAVRSSWWQLARASGDVAVLGAGRWAVCNGPETCWAPRAHPRHPGPGSCGLAPEGGRRRWLRCWSDSVRGVRPLAVFSYKWFLVR